MNRFIWRGQRKDWELKSSFDRYFYYEGLLTSKIREEILEELFNNFKEKLEELKQEDPKKLNKIDFSNLEERDKNAIWVIGRMYFLPTPTIDWTEDPYISAYFAFFKKSKEKHFNRVVYAMDIITLKKLMLKIILKRHCERVGIKGSKRYVEIPDINREILDDDIINRLEKQKSVIIRALNGIDIEKSVIKLVEKKSEYLEQKRIILAKIFISNELRNKCLNYLKQEYKEKITHIKLFSDYHGAVESCKIDIDFENNN